MQSHNNTLHKCHVEKFDSNIALHLHPYAIPSHQMCYIHKCCVKGFSTEYEFAMFEISVTQTYFWIYLHELFGLCKEWK